MSDQTELSLVPETQGRSAAGVSHTSTGQAKPTRAIASPPQANWRTAAGRPRGATHIQATASAGTTSSAAPILASNPSPTHTPASTSQRVRPSSSPRTTNHSAATQHSTSSVSGLLYRAMATNTGVTASASPPTNPANRPKRRRTRS